MKRKQFIKNGLLSGTAMIAGMGMLSSCTKKEESKIESVNFNFNKSYNFRMVSVWPKNFPIFGEADHLFMDSIEKMSGNRIKFKLFSKGELVPAYESFDAVQDGTADVGAGVSYYWMGKAPASVFFSTVPFGMNAQQHEAWLISGGGLDLWKEVYRPFNLMPLISGNSGVQMGGWFNREINELNDLRGLKMRIPGIGGKVLEKAGGAAMNIPVGEIYTNLERGVIDATEWVGPCHDYLMGFPKVAKYYYTPGWHEPGTQLEYFVNLKTFENLSLDLQEIIVAAAAKVQNWMHAELDVQNAEYLEKIKEGDTVIKIFPRDVMAELKKYTDESIAELISEDKLAKKVAGSYYEFKSKLKPWTDLTEKVYYNTIQDI